METYPWVCDKGSRAFQNLSLIENHRLSPLSSSSSALSAGRNLLGLQPLPVRIGEYIAIVIGALFLLIGVKQWLVLSKWTKKYKKYKEMQSKVDEKLNFDSNGSEQK